MRADRFVHVAQREIDALELAGLDGSAVQHHGRRVEAHERHRRAGAGLIAREQPDERIEHVTAADEFDRIGDHLAAHQRRFHSLGAHRDAVADRDGVELHRRSAGVPHAAFDLLGQLAQVVAARHRLDPRVCAMPTSGLARSVVS
jgi:hypothetical protein